MPEEGKVRIIEIKPESIEINKDSIVERLGYQKNKIEKYLSDTVQSCINKCIPLLLPEAGFIIQSVITKNWKRGLLEIDSIEWNVNKIISSQIKEADYIALFIGTIGREIENFSTSLFNDGDLLEGYIVNLIGSEAAESVAEIVHKTIEEKMKLSELECTNRFSPGYCKWNVIEQFKIFKCFPQNFCGISLTDSALMNPVKSVSGIIGLGKNVHRKEYPCKVCDEKKCIYKDRYN
jgi:hypothetical protein